MIQRYYKSWFILLISILLISCATSPQLDTPKKQLTALDLQVQAVMSSAYELTVAGVLQKDDVDSLIQQANQYMMLAWVAYGKGDWSDMNNKMQLVNSLLLEIRAILVAKENT